MATAAEDIDPIDPPAEDPNAEKPGEGEDGNGEDSPYAPLAKDMGWVPKDQFQGNPEEWKPADQFIRDGRDIQRETARELKNVRSQLETVARTSASIVEQQVKERVDQLTQHYNKAVEDGDPQEAFRLSREIDKTINSKPEATVAPSSEAAAFAERNASWFQKPGNEYATARAIEICNTLAAQGYTDHGTQLRIAEQRLKQEMPQLFGQQQNGKPAPGVNAPGSRGAPPSNRQKGFGDLPQEAQKIAIDMESRGVIKSRDDYARNYFANTQGKA
jgi:hypothetical protein